MYKKAKIYCDGNAYIAIPRSNAPSYHKVPRLDDVIKVKKEIKVDENGIIIEAKNAHKSRVKRRTDEETNLDSIEEFSSFNTVEIEVPVFKRKHFDTLYEESAGLSLKERKEYVFEKMKPYFPTDELLNIFIEENFQRKYRNLIQRRKRMVRKAYLYKKWNYFITFTYNSKLLTEEEFESKFSNFLKKNVCRKGWKYIGVWERGGKTERLHFHGIFDIPEGTLPGPLIKCEDYDFKTHQRKITYQCEKITEKFGRNDFESIDENDLSRTLGYLMKYLEKSGERIVYSGGLPEFRVSDIREEDVIAPMGKYFDRLLLFDNFECIVNGSSLGPCTLENLFQLPSK